MSAIRSSAHTRTYEGAGLEIVVDDYDALGANDFMGQVHVPLGPLNDKLRHRSWHSLVDDQNTPDVERGQIQVVGMWWKYSPRIHAQHTRTHAHARIQVELWWKHNPDIAAQYDMPLSDSESESGAMASGADAGAGLHAGGVRRR